MHGDVGRNIQVFRPPPRTFPDLRGERRPLGLTGGAQLRTGAHSSQLLVAPWWSQAPAAPLRAPRRSGPVLRQKPLFTEQFSGSGARRARCALPSLKTRLCAIYRAGQLIAAKPTKGVKCCGADGHLCATGRGESLVRRNIDATASQLKWVRTQLSATVVCGMVCGMDVSDDDVDK